MLNIIYEPLTNLFTFMCKPDDEKVEELGIDASDIAVLIDELLEAVSGEFALFASCIPGNTEENYLQLVKALCESGKDKKVIKAVNEVYEDNKEQIFLNDETKEECVEIIALEYKKTISDFPIDKKGLEEMKELLVSGFIMLMQDMYDTDVSYVFEEDFNPDKSLDDDNDEFEDDLF